MNYFRKKIITKITTSFALLYDYALGIHYMCYIHMGKTYKGMPLHITLFELASSYATSVGSNLPCGSIYMTGVNNSYALKYFFLEELIFQCSQIYY